MTSTVFYVVFKTKASVVRLAVRRIQFAGVKLNMDDSLLEILDRRSNMVFPFQRKFFQA
jgi:hypothetical protein